MKMQKVLKKAVETEKKMLQKEQKLIRKAVRRIRMKITDLQLDYICWKIGNLPPITEEQVQYLLAQEEAKKAGQI